MFEHFGIMDIFSGFRKYKYAMLTTIIGFFILFSWPFLISVKLNSESDVPSEDKIYISSASYYVEPNKEILGLSDSNLYKTMPDDYIAMLNTDFCRKFIFDKLLSSHSKQFIIENSGLNSEEAMLIPNEMGIDSMKELYFAKKYSGTMMIEISCITYNKELSNEVRDICEEFLILNANNKITTSSVQLYGKAEREIKTSDILNENIDKNDKRNIVKAPVIKKVTFKSLIKKIFIPMFLIIVLCTAFVIIMGFINPTLNRLSDFSEYCVPIIGEIKNYKKMKGMK